MIVLRDYQDRLIQDGRAEMRRHRRVLFQLPTGGGKTPIASFMAGQTAAGGRTCWFICHRAELVEQTSKTFRKFGIEHGIIAAGYPMSLGQPVQVCSIDTLKTRLCRQPLAGCEPPRLIIWDECHHVGAAGWSRVMSAFPASFHVGLTATPWRLDGSGLDEHFDAMVCGPSVAWLIENGFLSEYRYIAPPLADLSGFKKKNDQLNDQAKVLDKPKLIGDAISHWRQYADGMRSVGFATTVGHSQHLAAMFNAAGIPAAHLDGGTPKAERRAIIRDFAQGSLLHLFNVSLFGEGFDLAAIADMDVTIDCVTMHRRTQSLSLFLQMVGRALRPAPGKTAVIIDHAGNYQLHGLPDDDREWTLEGREKGGRSSGDSGPPPPVVCEGCFNAIRRPLPPACPHCGKTLVDPYKPPEVGDGQLVEITAAHKAELRRQQKREQAEAETLQDLVTLAIRRGYANPQRWAYKVWSNRPASRRGIKAM